MYTPHIHSQEIRERCSLPYELGQGRCGVQLYVSASELHHLVVNSVGAIQIQQTKKSSPLTEKGEPPSLEQEKRRRGEAWRTVRKPRHVLACIDQRLLA